MLYFRILLIQIQQKSGNNFEIHLEKKQILMEFGLIWIKQVIFEMEVDKIKLIINY